MYRTKYGPFDGNSWEDLCQHVFKKLHKTDGYQEMPASPGDFGIEGFTHSGLSFQCYCPSTHYSQDELYENQRDKITKDLKKLDTYKAELSKRLGSVKIKKWIFVCPEINRNKLLAHAKSKEEEVKSWGLPFIDHDFIILLQDADFYASEIHEIRSINGNKIVFETDLPIITKADDITIDYEENVDRKNRIRSTNESGYNSSKHNKLNASTVRKWMEGEGKVKRIEEEAPQIYYDLARVINQYESEIMDECLSWDDTPDKLVAYIKNNLTNRITEEIPLLSPTDRHAIADHMVSKWLAICTVDFE